MGGCASTSAKVVPAPEPIKDDPTQHQRPPPPKATFFLVGIDGAGKTTIYNTLAGVPDKTAKPTMGASRPLRVEGLKSLSPEISDLGGSSNFRKAWKSRYHRSHGLIFVIDASDESKLPEARDELQKCMSHEKVSGKTILIFANKQDVAGAIQERELMSRLGIAEGPAACPFKVFKVTAKKSCNGDVVDSAINQGLQWLAESISKEWSTIEKRVMADVEAKEKETAIQREKERKEVEEIRRKREEAKAAAERGEKPQDKVEKKQEEKKPKVVLCKNTHTEDDKVIQCDNEATVRNSSTGWKPMCASCAAEQNK